MHPSSFDHMQDLARRYLARERSLHVLDIGSYDVNGSYRPIFDRPSWRYQGLDLSAGPNVDIVLATPYRFPVKSNSVDVVISGQAFEHIEFFWLTWLELVRVVRPGGLIFLIAPSSGAPHRYPVDCWRYYPDGFRALARYGAVKLIEVSTDWKRDPGPHDCQWMDTVGVFRKPEVTPFERIVANLEHIVLQRLSEWIVRRHPRGHPESSPTQ